VTDRGWMTGGPIERLKAGWAKFAFSGRRVHFWTEDTTTMPPTINEGRVRFYTALCGVLGVTNGKVPALHEGNWPRCKRCERKMADA
jgi:hypothetical protein